MFIDQPPDSFRLLVAERASRTDATACATLRQSVAATFLIGRTLQLPMTVSVGEPKRNKDHQRVHFPKRKAAARHSVGTLRGEIAEAMMTELVAKIVSIDRFLSPASWVGYFGVFPEANDSGVDRYGNAGTVPTAAATQQSAARTRRHGSIE